jgi:glutaredoxin-like protein NrdH
MTSVTVYSTGAACMRCTLTCRCLSAAGIPFTVIDLTDECNAAHREFVTEDLGYTEAPVVMVDSEPEHHWSGFRPDLIDRLATRLIGAQP